MPDDFGLPPVPPTPDQDALARDRVLALVRQCHLAHAAEVARAVAGQPGEPQAAPA